MKPLVSIVMPVFNVQDILQACLDSVLAQTFTDFELICIDDGSTDASGEILERYAARDQRVRVLHQKNRGQYPTRNVGLELVRGKYMLSVDCDDVVASEFVERLVHRAETDSADITLVGWDYLSGPYRSPDVRRWNLRAWRRGERSNGFPMAYGYVWMKLYRTDFLRRYGLRFREEFYTKADLIFHWKTMSLAEWVSVVPEPLYHYRVHANSVTGTIGPRFIQVIHVMEAIREDIQDLEDPKGLLPAWYPFALGFIRSAYFQLAPEYRPAMEEELKKFMQRLGGEGHALLRRPGSISRDVRYFFRALESPGHAFLFRTLYGWRKGLMQVFRQVLFPRPMRRRLLAVARAQSYSLSHSSVHDLRDSVDELNETVDRLSAENFRLRQAASESPVDFERSQ
ncbi:glycosyltransferase [Aquisalimonas sp. 2447]|uniref:glycosyltransferase family 2 protein n=1 Tax=Aquisalimonas sp. 2447 TaxID=2740807 RepID=UPI0014323894|nr:glycosyltransferase [Aquisalimonas sp. 2447]QIT56548.1 glycosyltransferase [Aquisalimonas sp. 2447]